MASIEREMVDTYKRLQPVPEMLAQIRSFVPRPKEKDYEFGEINRYFAQQTNSPLGEITEISKQTFQTLRAESLYTAVEIRWKISGRAEDAFDSEGRLVRPGIATANTAAVERAAKTIPAITQKLTNPFQFWRGF